LWLPDGSRPARLCCPNRSQDQTGAAPVAGDTTATHVIDTTRTGPPATTGRPGASRVTLDSVGLDSTKAWVDTLHGQSGAGAVSSPQDTLGPRPAAGDTSAAGMSDSAKAKQSKSGVTDTKTGQSTLGPDVTKTRPDQGQPVTSKGDTINPGIDSSTSARGCGYVIRGVDLSTPVPFRLTHLGHRLSHPGHLSGRNSIHPG
jgi:hypothetical protein